ncbi:hypothetical protein Tco_0664524 [Tanacetum coccineum]
MDGGEDEDDEDEEEHLALADSAVVVPTVELVSPPEGIEPIIPPPSTGITTTRARINVRIQASISLLQEAEVKRLLAMPTTTTTISIHTTTCWPYEVDKSSTARPIGGLGVDYGFVSTIDAKERRRGIREVGYGIGDTWVDSAKVVPEIAPMTVGEVNTRVIELAELPEHDA